MCRLIRLLHLLCCKTDFLATWLMLHCPCCKTDVLATWLLYAVGRLESWLGTDVRRYLQIVLHCGIFEKIVWLRSFQGKLLIPLVWVTKIRLASARTVESMDLSQTSIKMVASVARCVLVLLIASKYYSNRKDLLAHLSSQAYMWSPFSDQHFQKCFSQNH